MKAFAEAGKACSDTVHRTTNRASFYAAVSVHNCSLNVPFCAIPSDHVQIHHPSTKATWRVYEQQEWQEQMIVTVSWQRCSGMKYVEYLHFEPYV